MSSLSISGWNSHLCASCSPVCVGIHDAWATASSKSVPSEAMRASTGAVGRLYPWNGR